SPRHDGRSVGGSWNVLLEYWRSDSLPFYGCRLKSLSVTEDTKDTEEECGELLLVMQSLHRIEARGLHRRIDAEDQPHEDRHRKRQEQRAAGDDRRPAGEARNEPRHRDPEYDAQRPAEHRNQRC